MHWVNLGPLGLLCLETGHRIHVTHIEGGKRDVRHTAIPDAIRSGLTPVQAANAMTWAANLVGAVNPP